jgi:hypothetical protein
MMLKLSYGASILKILLRKLEEHQKLLAMLMSHNRKDLNFTIQLMVQFTLSRGVSLALIGFLLVSKINYKF